MKIHPILLAGGSGTRLWPLSRKSYPKQFSHVLNDKSLFQYSALRLKTSDKIEFAPHITLTNSDFRFIVAEQMQEVGIEPGPILIEPEAKNTAPAVLTASLYAYEHDKDAVLLVAPSDHVIPDADYFHETLSIGLGEVQKGKMVTFGITPTKPETGYGYLELPEKSDGHKDVSEVVNFLEKPNLTDAQRMFESGNFLWNSGIFLFRATDMIEAFKNYAPSTLPLVKDALRQASSDLGFLRLEAEPWEQIQDISIDYAIMEKAKNLMAVKFSSRWSDLGGWDAVWEESEKDVNGNVLRDESFPIDCTNTLLRSHDKSQKIVGLGLDNIIAIAMSDAVFVTNRENSQNVRNVVDLLKQENIPQAEVFPREFRPWGWSECLVSGDGFQVKRIYIKAEAGLSLQNHNYRSEHWVVIDGTAEITVGDEVKIVTQGQSVYVPPGDVHKIRNPGDGPVGLIEVQIGSYLGEDDIVRYEDNYQNS